MKIRLTAVLLFLTTLLIGANDSAWTNLQVDKYGSTVKVIGESKGSYWTWSQDKKTGKNYLNCFDTTCRYLRSVKIDTQQLLIADIFALRDGLVGTAVRNAYRDDAEMLIFTLSADGMMTVTNTYVSGIGENKKLFAHSVAMNEARTHLIVMYRFKLADAPKGSEAYTLEKYDANGEKVGTGSILIPKDFQKGILPHNYKLRCGRNGDIYIIGQKAGLKPSWYFLCIGEDLVKKSEYVPELKDKTILNVDVFTDASDNPCLVGISRQSTTVRVFVLGLDRNGVLKKYTDLAGPDNCFLAPTTFFAGRSTSFSTHWQFDIVDYGYSAWSDCVLFINYGYARSSYSNAIDGATFAFHSQRFVVNVGADMAIRSADYLHEIFEGTFKGKTGTEISNAFAAEQFHAKYIYNKEGEEEIGQATKYIACTGGAFFLRKGEELQFVYNSGRTDIPTGCISKRLNFETDPIKTYSVNVAKNTGLRRTMIRSELDGNLFLNVSYTFRLRTDCVLVIMQHNGEQFLGKFS